jgi:aminoglycoside 2''-phosphotransferase
MVGMERNKAIEQLISSVLSDLHIAEYTQEAQSSGQNNDVVTIRTAPAGSELVLRFPRHPVAVAELAHEVKLLEGLRERLPLAIPDPVCVNLSTQKPGQVFMGYWKLPGEPPYLPLLEKAIHLTGTGASDHIAAQVGAFLVALHAVPLDEFDPPLPVANQRATWERMYADVRSKLFAAMRPDARQKISLHFESYLEGAASSAWEPALIHGDFGPSNILYDKRTRSLSGIIDWSSAGAGDPATDLAALIGPVSYGEDFADALVSSYPALAAELPRARFYLGTFALQDALFGLETGDEQAYEAGMSQYR